MNSSVGQVPVIRNKRSQREKVVSTVERNRHIPKVSVLQRRQSTSSVGRKGITVPQRVKSKYAGVNELQVQSTTTPECADRILDEYEPV